MTVRGTRQRAREMLRVVNLHKWFGRLHVLKGISMAVNRGEVVVIIGPSGSGKSTLLRCINYLSPPSRGDIYIDGVKIIPKTDIDSMRKDIPMVFQHFNLFFHLRVEDNVKLALKVVLKLDRDEQEERCEEALEKMGLLDKADAYPGELSGGQQQRVAIARALAMKPKAVMFDEPTSALDPELIGEVLDAMRNLAEEGMTMLVITHEMHFAKEVADRIVFMDKGKVVEEGPPGSILVSPRFKRTAKFLGLVSKDKK